MGRNTTAPTIPASQPPVRSAKYSNPEVNPTFSFSTRYILVASGNSNPISKPETKNSIIKINGKKFVYPVDPVIITAVRKENKIIAASNLINKLKAFLTLSILFVIRILPRAVPAIKILISKPILW